MTPPTAPLTDAATRLLLALLLGWLETALRYEVYPDKALTELTDEERAALADQADEYAAQLLGRVGLLTKMADERPPVT